VVQADGKPGGAGKLPRDRVIGRAKVPILGGGGAVATIYHLPPGHELHALYFAS